MSDVKAVVEVQQDWVPKEDLRPFAGEWVALRHGYIVEHDRDLARLCEHPSVRVDDVFFKVPRHRELV